MQHHKGQTWTEVRDPLGSVYEDLDLLRCSFKGCSFGQQARLPSQRTVVRRVHATNCTFSGGPIGPVFFEDVHISGRRGSNVWAYGALFKHVTLSGKVGGFVLKASRWGSAAMTDELRASEAAFTVATAAFYASIDWALDISKAEFSMLDWRLEMPSRLVRRDPETQFVARRERVIDRRWQQIPLDWITSIGLSNFLDFGHAERIFAAPKASKQHFKEELESLQLLRKEGILEPE